MRAIQELLTDALRQGKLLQSSYENILSEIQRAGTASLLYRSIAELIALEDWTELNDRFFRHLRFGTGGLRGRTIGKTITDAERGNAAPNDCPQYPAVGTNMMNYDNVERATRGLCRYIVSRFPQKPCSIVIAHDVRHFSRQFCLWAAQIANNEGVNAYIFPDARSTPMLSFSVRHLRAQAGVVITASHNPPYDNGFKAYFDDGAQLVEPHASGVITAAAQAEITADTTPQNGACTITLGPEIEEAYQQMLLSLPLSDALRTNAHHLPKVVYTPLHGTGQYAIPSVLQKLGVNYEIVSEQTPPDGNFPTVTSPNPENGEALAMGIALAQRCGAALVIGTDPDADRMGAAVRSDDGQFVLLTGNQICTILAYFRTAELFRRGILDDSNKHRACIIKTFVTTEMLRRIAEHFGVKLINTLTGFKYIGQKLKRYEDDVLREVPRTDYHSLPLEQRRSLQLRYGTYFIFGGEESYGYSGTDAVRDKDANAATVMLLDVFAHAHTQGKSLLEYLDDIYCQLGYYREKLGQLVMEGAQGAAQIQALLHSYTTHPPTSFAGAPVIKSINHANDTLYDADGDLLPKELMLVYRLQNGAQILIRGSGTEPKIKYYLSAGRDNTTNSPWTQQQLSDMKNEIDAYIEQLWQEVHKDALQRIG